MNPMAPTRIRLLLTLALIAGAIGWGLMTISEGRSGRVVPVPWAAAATMWLLAIALGVWALLARPRLLRHPGHRPLSPFVAARTAALAMAASRTGSLVAGFYLGMGLGALPSRTTSAGSTALWAALACTVGSIALVVIALWLEHLCRLPSDGDDAEPNQRAAHRGRAARGEPGSVSARIGSGHERRDAP